MTDEMSEIDFDQIEKWDVTPDPNNDECARYYAEAKVSKIGWFMYCTIFCKPNDHHRHCPTTLAIDYPRLSEDGIPLKFGQEKYCEIHCLDDDFGYVHNISCPLYSCEKTSKTTYNDIELKRHNARLNQLMDELMDDVEVPYFIKRYRQAAAGRCLTEAGKLLTEEQLAKLYEDHEQYVDRQRDRPFNLSFDEDFKYFI